MTDKQERKEYRKNLVSSGQLRIAGETLDIKSCDVSLKGIKVEIFPGKFLAQIEDFEAFLADSSRAEIFVNDLMLVGEVDVVWCRDEDGKILLGLEYRDDVQHEKKSWLKRVSYRKNQPFNCTILIGNEKVEAYGNNISIDGMSITGDLKEYGFKVGDLIKLIIHEMAIKKAVARIIWINNQGERALTLGLRYLEID